MKIRKDFRNESPAASKHACSVDPVPELIMAGVLVGLGNGESGGLRLRDVTVAYLVTQILQTTIGRGLTHVCGGRSSENGDRIQMNSAVITALLLNTW